MPRRCRLDSDAMAAAAAHLELAEQLSIPFRGRELAQQESRDEVMTLGVRVQRRTLLCSPLELPNERIGHEGGP